jgi:cytidylate kinase
MIITLSGLPGSGKSSVAKLLAKKLGFRHYSTGDIQRKLAKKHGYSISEWGRFESEHEKFDLMIDEETRHIATQNDDIVIDSWLAPHFVKTAVKVFLECDEQERARRRVSHKRIEEQFDSIPQTIDDMRKRVKNNRERWQELYSYDFLNMSHYNLVIDTTNLGIEQVVGKIIEFIENAD